MTNRLTSLILLLVLGCALIAGPHPCQARATAPEAAASEEVKAVAGEGCHSHAAPSPASNTAAGPSVSSGGGAEDCCAGHGALCQAACQPAAIIGTATLAFAVLPSVQAQAPAFESALPPFSQGIDHIPLV